MSKTFTLTHVLKKQRKKVRLEKESDGERKRLETELKTLQLRMLRIQQAVWQRKKRVILVFEGFDASGKGGAIRALTEGLDPRGVVVNPIGPPSALEQGTHYLYRFWTKLPPPGQIAVFDRSWYGRVLVERVEKLVPHKTWQRAYDEIQEFERMLVADGVLLLKFCLAVSKEEQLRRFEERLHDPYKQWKLTLDDLRARAHWDKYVEATDELLEKTNTPHCPWFVIPANRKPEARVQILEIVTRYLQSDEEWMEAQKGLVPDEKEIRKVMKLLAKA
jgi:polyphosphate kinase 2 (PPK2 family)